MIGNFTERPTHVPLHDHARLGCSSTEAAAGVRDYTLVFLKTGPQSGKLAPTENEIAFAGHFSNMERLAREHKLLVAGPFGESRHDTALRGLFVLASGSRDEARAWAQTDPPSMLGIFTQEFHVLRTGAPLLAAMESDLALRDAEKLAGHTPDPGAGARSYVLLTAEHGELAQRELNRLGPANGVLLVSTLDNTRCFALLDAQNVAQAEQRFGELLGRVGAHVLDDWFASAQLARLGEFAAK